MAADSYDITIDQRADWFWTIRWLVGFNRVPKDVTGYTGTLAIADGYNYAEPVLTLEADVIPGDGTFAFHATAAQTSTLPVGRRLRYEVVVTDTVTARKLSRGAVTVAP